MKTVLSYFGKYKKQIVLSPLFKLLEACFELIVPLVIASVINEGINTGNYDLVYKRVGLLAVFAVVGFASAICAQYFAAFAACSISSDIRFDLFKKIQSLSVTEFEKIGSSKTVTALTSDVNQISAGINLFLRLLLRSPFVVLGATIMAFTVSPRLALIFVAVVSLLGLIVFVIMRSSIPLFKTTRDKLDSLVSYTANGLAGVKVIRAYNRSADDSKGFCSLSGDLKQSQLKASGISVILNPLTYLIINLAIVFLFYRGNIHVSSGLLKDGMVVALYQYMSQILVELIKLANLIVNVNRAIACAGRVEYIMKIPQEEEKNGVIESGSNAQGIVFDHVSFTYQGNSEESLHDISFEIKPGEKIGLIGKTGSGKSTITSLMSGLYKPDSGCVRIGGQDINELSVSSLVKTVGTVLQKSRMFSRSINDNIRLGRDSISDRDLSEAVRASRTDDVIASKEEGGDYMLSANGTGLSGGQKQRINIARAVAGKPGVLILDDSTSALDAATERAVISNISDLENKPTTVIVSQKIRTVIACDRIMFVNEGRLEAFAPHEELLKISPDYSELYKLQKDTEVT